jgi:hypothetical protein
MIKRALRLLPPGSLIRHVAAADTGSLGWALLLGLIGYSVVVVPALLLTSGLSGQKGAWPGVLFPLSLLLGMVVARLLSGLVIHHRVIAVTDEAVSVLDSGRFRKWTPRRVVDTFPRSQLGPLRRSRVTIGDQRLRVYSPWSGEIQAADWDLFTRAAATAGVAVSDDGRWTWDGGHWRPIPAGAPAGAQLSRDGCAWWDGEAWRVRPAGSLSAT